MLAYALRKLIGVCPLVISTTLIVFLLLKLLPGDPVYAGMIVGEHNRGQDINVNPCKEKKLSNMRASGKDENVILSPINQLTLEQSIGFIREDELLEITPRSIRMRKAVLSAQERHNLRSSQMKMKAAG